MQNSILFSNCVLITDTLIIYLLNIKILRGKNLRGKTMYFLDIA